MCGIMFNPVDCLKDCQLAQRQDPAMLLDSLQMLYAFTPRRDVNATIARFLVLQDKVFGAWGLFDIISARDSCQVMIDWDGVTTRRGSRFVIGLEIARLMGWIDSQGWSDRLPAMDDGRWLAENTWRWWSEGVFGVKWLEAMIQ